MALHAVGRRHHENRVVERLQRALGLRGKIDVAGGVEDCELRFADAHHRRLGVDGDAARAFHRIGVEERVAVVHTAQSARGASGVQQCLGQRGLAGVHMRHDSRYDPLHRSLLSVRNVRHATPNTPPCTV